MRFAQAVLLTVASALACATSARAQSADSLRTDSLRVDSLANGVTEVQVPFDQRGGVLIVDRALAHRIGVFIDRYPRFREARLFRDATGRHVLEVMSAPDEPGATREARVRERVPLTAEQVDALRTQVTAGLEAHAPERLQDQEGRPWLVSGLTLLGLGWYGWSIPASFDFESSQSSIGTYMLVSSASFVVPYLLTTTATVTEADAQLALYGATRGIVHGFLVSELSEHENWDDTPAISTAMSVGECALLYAWSRTGDLDAGTTGSMGLYSDYMTWSAFGLADVLAPAGEDASAARAGAALAGAGVGLVTGRILGHGRGYSRGDAGVMHTTMLVGGFVGAAAGDLAGEDSEPVVLGAVAGGGTAIAIGNMMVRGHEFSTGQSRLAFLGALAGGLFGLGASFAIDTENAESAPQASALGSALGLLAVYAQLEERAEDFAVAPAERAREARLGLAVHPEALFVARRPDASGRASSLVTASWRFGEGH